MGNGCCSKAKRPSPTNTGPESSSSGGGFVNPISPPLSFLDDVKRLRSGSHVSDDGSVGSASPLPPHLRGSLRPLRRRSSWRGGVTTASLGSRRSSFESAHALAFPAPVLMLPDEALVLILDLLDADSLAAAARVCSLWRAAATFVALEGRTPLPPRLWVLSDPILRMYMTRNPEFEELDNFVDVGAPLQSFVRSRKRLGLSRSLTPVGEIDPAQLKLDHPFTAVESDDDGHSDHEEEEEEEEEEEDGEEGEEGEEDGNGSMSAASMDSAISHTGGSSAGKESVLSYDSSDISHWNMSWWSTEPPTSLCLRGAAKMDTGHLLTLLTGIESMMSAITRLDLSHLQAFMGDPTGFTFGGLEIARERARAGSGEPGDSSSAVSLNLNSMTQVSSIAAGGLSPTGPRHSLLPFLAQQTQLEEVDVSRTWGVNEVTLAVLLRSLPQLRVFKAEACLDIVGGITLSPAHSPRLTTLVLSHCYDLAYVAVEGKMTSLSTLHLAGAPLPEVDLEVLFQSVPSLSDVDVSRVPGVTNKVVFAMAMTAGPRIVRLNLEGCTAVTTLACRHLASSCPAMEVLSLNGCHLVNYDGIDELFDSMPYLTTLDVGSCLGFRGDISVMAPSSLTTLNISHCSAARFVAVTGRSLRTLLFRSNELTKKFAANLKTPELEVLDLTLAAPCSDSRLLAIGGRCPSLKTLIISSTRFASLRSFLFAFRSLERLDVNQCFQCSDDDLWAVARWCENLKVMSIWGLDLNISAETIGEVQDALPGLKVIRSVF